MKNKIIYVAVAIMLTAVLARAAEPTCSVALDNDGYVVSVHKDGIVDLVMHHAMPDAEVHKPIVAVTEKHDVFKATIKWGKGYDTHDENSSFVGDVRFVAVTDTDNTALTLHNVRKIYAKTDINGTLSASIPANWKFRLQANSGVEGDDGWHIHYPILKMNGYGTQYRWVGKCDDRQIVTGAGVKTGWMKINLHDSNVTK